MASQVHVRNECKTRFIGEVNKNLTNVQRSRIEATPFKWLMCLPKNLNISGKLLRELVGRWDERSGVFIVGGTTVRFSPLDVCFALGLCIIGDNVQVEEDTESEYQRLFNNKNITVEGIYEKLFLLHSDDDVKDFCRLYILLGLTEFYFPKSTPTVHGGWFKLLNDLHSLGKYNWGLAVYDFLVKGLTRAASSLLEEVNSSQLHIIGCAVVLQVWACEHVLVYHRTTPNVVSTFPRFLKWHDVKIGETNISSSLEQNLVIEEFSATHEELAHDVMREALDLAPGGFIHWRKQRAVNSAFDKKKTIAENRWLLAENNKLEARMSALEQELGEIKQLLCQSETSTKAAAPQSDYGMEDMDVDNEEEEEEEVIHATHRKDHKTSNIYTRLKDNPRKRADSNLMRTPWIRYAHRTKRKTQVKGPLKLNLQRLFSFCNVKNNYLLDRDVFVEEYCRCTCVMCCLDIRFTCLKW